MLVKTPAKLKGSHRVAGEFDQIIGSRPQYAKIEFLVEPRKDSRSETTSNPRSGARRTKDFGRANIRIGAVLGLLDLVLVAWTQPLRNIKVRITSAGYQLSWSSLMAFRMAGWDAGKKLVEAEKKAKP